MFDKIRKSLFSLLPALIVILLTAGCQTEKSDEFRFVFMTDIHVQPEQEATEGMRTAIAKVNELQPDFVITGGDQIMDALGQSFGRADSLYKLYQKCQQELGMPVYNTIGNHELFGLYEKSGVSPDHPEYAKAMFARRIGAGATYSSFDYKGWHFMLLDGIGQTADRHYYGNVDSLQLEWIKDDLSRIAPEMPIVVSIHIPLTSVSRQMLNGATAAMSRGEVVVNSKEVLDLFDQHNLKLVLQGHLHIIEEIIFNDIHFITAGSVCGHWWKGPHYGFPEGFAVIDISGDEFTWYYQTFGWESKF